MVVEDKYILGQDSESAGEVSRMTLTFNTFKLITMAAIQRYILYYHRPSVRTTSKSGGSRRDRARYSQSYLRAVSLLSQGPLQRLRTGAPPFYFIGPRPSPSLYRTSGLVVSQVSSDPLI